MPQSEAPPGNDHPNAPRELRVAKGKPSLALPYNQEAESSVLGGVLLYEKALDQVVDVVASADFYHPLHREIYKAFLDLRAALKPIDPITVADQMRANGSYSALKAFNGEAYFSELTTAVVTVENLKYHAELVLDAARRRRLIEYHESGKRAAGDLNLDVDQLLEHNQLALKELDLEPTKTAQVAPPLVAESVRADWARPLPPAIPTKIRQLDRAVGGLRAEATYVMAGGTGAGKSGLALQFAANVEQDRPVAYFSTELSRRQCTARLIAQRLGRRWEEIYNLGPSETDRLVEAIHGQRIRIIEVGRKLVLLDVLDAIAQIDGEPPLLFFDYLQGYARRRSDSNDLRGAVASLSDELNTWARDTRSTAFVLSSVARHLYGAKSAKENADKSATDFAGAGKDAGEIEFDARCVLYLDTETCPLDGESPAKLNVAKSTFGGAGTIVGLRFRGAYGTFVEDESAKLGELDIEILEAIRNGCTSRNDIVTKLKKSKQRVLFAIKRLVGAGLVSHNLGQLALGLESGAK
jgi:replicative DNA helicase